jgi:FAD synthetase
MKKVMLFGTFNVIHPGHLNLFRQAKSFGDKLYVVVARDSTVEELKNYNPIGEIQRMHNLKKVPIIDEVILGDPFDRFKAIKNIKPDVICIGYDQAFFVKELEAFIAENNQDIMIMKLRPYKPHKYKGHLFRD